jgi:hypothetical protein
MTKYMRIVFLHIILLSNVWSINATSGIYKLKATICKSSAMLSSEERICVQIYTKRNPFQ